MMHDKFEQLLAAANGLPRGDTRVAMFEEAVRLADTHLTSVESYRARMKLTDAATTAGRGEKAIMSFAWCLSEFDQNPYLYDEFDILWHYKWIASRLNDFTEVSLEKIHDSFEDLRSRFLSAGYNERMYFKYKMNLADHLGDMEQFKTYYEKWRNEPDDYMSDCSACEKSRQAGVLLTLGRYAEADQVAAPLFSGEEGCRGVPHYTYGRFLLPLLKQNRWDEAAEYHRKGMELIHGKSGFLEAATNHFVYLAIVDVDQAITHFEQYLPQAQASFVSSSKFYFYRAAVALFDQLDEQGKQVLQLPAGTTIQSIKQELQTLADKFDQRNGNDRFNQRITELHQDIATLKASH